jgi:hypothetical protein
MSKKREAIVTTIVILIIILIPTNILADPRPYPHYHQYYDPATPTYYLSQDFTLTVRLILEDKEMKDDMPFFYIWFGNEEKTIPGSDFEDDGVAKVIFVVNRDNLPRQEVVTVGSSDNQYSKWLSIPTTGNSFSVKWTIPDND